MITLIQEYQASITPMLERIVELNREIATAPSSSDRDKLVKRRTELWREIQEMQADIREMLDRDWKENSPRVLPAEPESGSENTPKSG